MRRSDEVCCEGLTEMKKRREMEESGKKNKGWEPCHCRQHEKCPTMLVETIKPHSSKYARKKKTDIRENQDNKRRHGVPEGAEESSHSVILYEDLYARLQY
jgi:hypothetical protein